MLLYVNDWSFILRIQPLCSIILVLSTKEYVLLNIACTFAISTLISKGLTIKSSPPILIAITIFILSDIEDINIIGTLDTVLICVHQWYPLKNGNPISISTRCGSTSTNVFNTSLKSVTTKASYPHFISCSFTVSAITLSSSTINILYIIFTF